MRLRDALARLVRTAAPLRGRGDRAAMSLMALLDTAVEGEEIVLDARAQRWLQELFTALELRVNELESTARRAREQPWRRL